VTFQTIATRIDNRTYAPRGQLYTVNGRQMHMVCVGQSDAGEPTVILHYHLGVGRLWVARSTAAMGYPPAIARELAAYTLRNQTCATDLAEHGYDATWALMQAALAAEDLGNLPMAMLWASESGTNQPDYAAYRQEVAGYSTNSVTRTITGADHGSILGNEQYAQQVSDAILAVINAAQTGEPLAVHQ